jgi:hypothetical protein
MSLTEEKAAPEVGKKCYTVHLTPTEAEDRSELFVEHVENFDPKKHPTADSFADCQAAVKLSKDKKQRSRQLLQIYTSDKIYGKLNSCLRNDDEDYMKMSAGYIYELREVFRTDDSILSFYKGIVYRGIYVADPGIILKGYEKDGEFVWASFTSTSVKKNAAENFGQGAKSISFEIMCSANIDNKKAKYAPADIAPYSVFPMEAEVLFPPHTKFRVVNIKKDKGNQVQLETTEYPSVWKVVENERWKDFEKWADVNSKRINTKHCSFSIINTVAKKVAAADKTDFKPLQVCIKYNADINEFDPESGNTPITQVANAFADAGLNVTNIEVKGLLTFLLQNGADPYKKSKNGKNAVQIMPKFHAIVHKINCVIGTIISEEKEQIDITTTNNVRWDYHVGAVPVDGKCNNWYPYHPSTWAPLEKRYQDYLKGFGSTTVIKSKGDAYTNFNYSVDFSTMMQTNMQTNTKRPIRRTVYTE